MSEDTKQIVQGCTTKTQAERAYRWLMQDLGSSLVGDFDGLDDSPPVTHARINGSELVSAIRVEAMLAILEDRLAYIEGEDDPGADLGDSIRFRRDSAREALEVINQWRAKCQTL